MPIDRPVRLRAGQALMELAVGVFALVLVVSALCCFAEYIGKSLRAQNALRENDGQSNAKSDAVQVDALASERIFGVETLTVSEKVVMPTRTIAK